MLAKQHPLFLWLIFLFSVSRRIFFRESLCQLSGYGTGQEAKYQKSQENQHAGQRGGFAVLEYQPLGLLSLPS